MQLDPISETPLFLIWAIKQSCQIKESFDFVDSDLDLLKLERTFRPLRCLSQARFENRTLGDLCILQSRNEHGPELQAIKGFSASEILDGFGGEEFVNSQCHHCDANVYMGSEREKTQGIAGCYGYLQSRYDDFHLFDQWQARTEVELFELWQTQSLGPDKTLSSWQMEKWLGLLSLNQEIEFHHSDTDNFRLALTVCQNFNRQLQVHVVPKSQIVDQKWIVPQHCSNCFVTLEKWMGNCPSCGSKASPISLRKRLLRGDRPYWPLVRFLGEEGTRQIVEQYFDHQPLDN